MNNDNNVNRALTLQWDDIIDKLIMRLEFLMYAVTL